MNPGLLLGQNMFPACRWLRDSRAAWLALTREALPKDAFLGEPRRNALGCSPGAEAGRSPWHGI